MFITYVSEGHRVAVDMFVALIWEMQRANVGDQTKEKRVLETKLCAATRSQANLREVTCQHFRTGLSCTCAV
jgi:hypothetical protein